MLRDALWLSQDSKMKQTLALTPMNFVILSKHSQVSIRTMRTSKVKLVFCALP